jgi:hypothetical protein
MKEYYSNSTIGFSSQAPTNKSRKRALLFIQQWVEFPRRRAHGFSKEGAPSVEDEAAKCGRVGCHLSTLQTSVKSNHIQGEGATSFICGLPPQEGATSPRGAHLSMPMCSYLLRYGINQVPINFILSPLTPS